MDGLTLVTSNRSHSNAFSGNVTSSGDRPSWGLPAAWRCNYEVSASVAIEALRSRQVESRTRDLYQEITSEFVPGASSGPPGK